MPTVILTGATRGIGRAAASALASRGAELALVGRDGARVRAIADEARASGGGAPVYEHVADLARMDDVRRLGAALLEAYPRIDVLANNAGAMFTSRHVTPDGFEQTFALNHLAPFALTNLLLERLTVSSGRVVTTASDAHQSGRLDLDDLQSGRGRFRPGRVYGTSKLCNILFTRELQRRNPAIAANCFHPGVIRSGLRQERRRAGADRPHPRGTVPALAREAAPVRSSGSRSIPPPASCAGNTSKSSGQCCRARRRRTTTLPPHCGSARKS